MKLNDLYGGNSKIFRITSIELKDSDMWVGYVNIQTNQSYTCRQEAFLARYNPMPT